MSKLTTDLGSEVGWEQTMRLSERSFNLGKSLGEESRVGDNGPEDKFAEGKVALGVYRVRLFVV